MPRIRLLPGTREVTAAAGGKLLDLALELGLSLPFGCQSARCGICRVELLQGTAGGLEPPSQLEKTVLAGLHAAPGVRLACQARLRGDVVIRPLHPGHEA